MDIKVQIGTVSHGTLRLQDLIPAYLTALSLYDSAAYAQVSYGMHPLLPSYAREDESDPWWTSDDAIWALETLEDHLGTIAPEGTYFGAHEGDGSDFGYWPEPDEPASPFAGKSCSKCGNVMNVLLFMSVQPEGYVCPKCQHGEFVGDDGSRGVSFKIF